MSELAQHMTTSDLSARPDTGSPSAGVDNAEREARLMLSLSIEPGDPRVAEAVARYGVVELWEQVATGQHPLANNRRRVDRKQVAVLEQASRTRFVVPGDQEWPEQLCELDWVEPLNGVAGAPLGLWVRGSGNLAQLANTSVSIVGSRAADEYGTTVAIDLSAQLVGLGWTITSGGAYGIDAAAHRGALAESSRAAEAVTVAVLARGVDAAYPSSNARLFGSIMDRGVIVSEYPPGASPHRHRFLVRNRLIAALSGGTVIVQAALRSGARNTANWAVRCSRPLMAIPGPVTHALSATPNGMIREQLATLVTGCADVVEMVSPLGHNMVPGLGREPATALDRLSTALLVLYEAFPARGTRDAAQLAAATGQPLPSVLAGTTELTDLGLLTETLDGWQLAT